MSDVAHRQRHGYTDKQINYVGGGMHAASGKLEMVVEPEPPEGAALVMAMVKQAMADLGNPDEREDAIEFLTDTLWNGDAEGLPLREMAPEFFVHEDELRERINGMIAGEIDLPEEPDDADGVIPSEEVANILNKGETS